MTGSLQATGWSFARGFGSVVIIAATASFLLAADYAYGGTPPTVDQATAARLADPGLCLADPRYVAPADVAAGQPWRLVPCTRWEADAVCPACATCGSGAWCAPVKTRGMGPRSPGGGPDD